MSAKRLGAEGVLADVTAALLVGGGSTRMGSDKAHLDAGGGALATSLAAGLAGSFGEVLLVGGDPPASAPGRRVADVAGPPCALRGVVSALAAAQTSRVLVVATDLPGLCADLVLALVAAPPAQVVLPRDGGGLQPLCALYEREPALGPLRAALASQRLGLQHALTSLTQFVLEGADLAAADPEGRALSNLNTKQDLRAWLARADGAPRW